MQRAGSAQNAPGPQVPVGRKRKFMPVREVADILGVSEMTIRRAYAAGLTPGITFGTSYRILAAFVAALIAEVEAGRQVNFEDFGREWAARNAAAGAVA